VDRCRFLFDEEPFPETAPEPTDLFENDDRKPTEHPTRVFKSDTRIIIHWNAQTGTVNYENGPPIDHPRLTALLCDATSKSNTRTQPANRLA
jgi:hypothetical protein